MTYLHPDHLGTPKYGTNAGGTQVWAWAPDAFGGGSPSGAATVNLRMPGQFYDAESSLFYNWNRYYNPATGRYISSDPIGLEGGINTFLYAAASPAMLTDPTGEFFWLPAIGFVLGYNLYSNPANSPAEGDTLYPRNDWAPVVSGLSLATGVSGFGRTTAAGVTPYCARTSFSEAGSAANAVKLNRNLSSQEGVTELLAGGGKVIAGAGTKRGIDDINRLINQYDGTAADWVKVTSTAPGRLQTHAYRNSSTGQVVELKSVIP